MTKRTNPVVARLRSRLERRAPATLSDDQAQRAAVALVVAAGGDPAILLVRRRERPGDPWSGHAAFPGGFRSAADSDAAATAERETEEETGLALARVGERIGVLDDVYPRSVYLPRVIVTPCVFAVPDRLPVAPSAETDQAVWVPVLALTAPENRQPYTLEHPSGRREFESIRFESLIIWGLTERIISQFVTLIS